VVLTGLTSCSAVQNVLLILLHRPFVADGHLQSKPTSVAVSSFLACAAAATEITNILRSYDRAFSFRRAPYLMSYATYVSATIHVRIAAQREQGSEAHACLITCLQMLKANEETNWAVRKASHVIHDLMNRMNVSVTDNSGMPPAAGSATHLPISTMMAPAIVLDAQEDTWPDLDIDAIIQSFMREQQALPSDRTMLGTALSNTAVYLSPNTMHQQDQQKQVWNGLHSSNSTTTTQFDGTDAWQEDYLQSASDMLFGFNGSAVDMSNLFS